MHVASAPLTCHDAPPAETCRTAVVTPAPHSRTVTRSGRRADRLTTAFRALQGHTQSRHVPPRAIVPVMGDPRSRHASPGRGASRVCNGFAVTLQSNPGPEAPILIQSNPMERTDSDPIQSNPDMVCEGRLERPTWLLLMAYNRAISYGLA